MSEVRQPKPFRKIGTIGLCLSLAPTLLSWGTQSSSIVFQVLRVVGPLCVAASLALRFWPGKPLAVNDYLTRCFGYEKFSRGRFSFAFALTSKDGVCFVELWYQNGYSTTCIPRVGLVPVSSFLQRKTGQVVQFQLRCEPGEFGVLSHAFPSITKPGTSGEFHAGVAVDFPDGLGESEPLEFMSGIPIERDPELADSAYFDAVTAVNLVVGRLSVKRPARVLFKVPKDVVGDAREPEKATTQTVHWKTGDEPVDFDKEIFATRTVATLKW